MERQTEQNSSNPERMIDNLEDVVILLKPGGAAYVERLIAFLQQHNLEVVGCKQKMFDLDTIKKFYPHAADKYLPNMEDYFSQEETMALLVSGINAIDICNRIKRHVRSIFYLKQPRDCIHVSDNVGEAKRESAVIDF